MLRLGGERHIPQMDYLLGPRPRSSQSWARTAGELVPIAGYYGRLVHSQWSPVLEGHGASDRGYADLRENPFPDIGRLCVLVPKKTENALRFSARLDDGTPEMRFDWAART
jgi:hypothetical protein